MVDELTIRCNWLQRPSGNDLDRSFYADIGIAVGQECLTELVEQLEASSVRNDLRGCAYQLAMWFAANWWRLRWEPEISNWRKNSDWRVAHSIAGTGNGYVWPNIIFASDGGSIAVASLPPKKSAAFEPIRYLNRTVTRISATEFEGKVDSFIGTIISRLHSRNVKDKTLETLWNEVLVERSTPKISEQRKLEAVLGFDPDEAPDKLLRQTLSDKTEFGPNAVTEIAAEARDSVLKVLELIRDLAAAKNKPKEEGFRVSLPKLNLPVGFAKKLDRPWQKGTELARFARAEWNLGAEPLTNKTLGRLLSSPVGLFKHGRAAATQIPVAVKKPSGAYFDIYLASPIETSRRFAMCRIIGDHLFFRDQEKLLPATRARTERQQFQRAFAQEFLCPIEVLKDDLPTQPDVDDISRAAKRFDVSPLLVRTTLVNKGELDRDALTWED
jgi:hypothetical protein